MDNETVEYYRKCTEEQITTAQCLAGRGECVIRLGMTMKDEQPLPICMCFVKDDIKFAGNRCETMMLDFDSGVKVDMLAQASMMGNTLVFMGVIIVIFSVVLGLLSYKFVQMRKTLHAEQAGVNMSHGEAEAPHVVVASSQGLIK